MKALRLLAGLDHRLEQRRIEPLHDRRLRIVSRISALMRSQISRGVPFGAHSPYQDWKS